MDWNDSCLKMKKLLRLDVQSLGYEDEQIEGRLGNSALNVANGTVGYIAQFCQACL